MFRYCNNKVPELFNSHFEYNSDYHNYNTRYAEHFHAPKVKTDLAKKDLNTVEQLSGMLYGKYMVYIMVYVQILQNQYLSNFLNWLLIPSNKSVPDFFLYMYTLSLFWLSFAILSITLFNVKINDIVKQVDHGVECSLYVDDVVIMYISPTIDAIQRKLQHAIHSLEKWTLQNGFTISKNKSVAMHFCPDKKCIDPVLKLDNDPIQFVKEAKFLGLIWDTKLTFEAHIKYLKARCQNH